LVMDHQNVVGVANSGQRQGYGRPMRGLEYSTRTVTQHCFDHVSTCTPVHMTSVPFLEQLSLCCDAFVTRYSGLPLCKLSPTMVRPQRPALFLTLPAARPVREDFANAAMALPRESPYISQHAAGVVIISGKLTLSRVLSLNEAS